jgi:hypothetical protein
MTTALPALAQQDDVPILHPKNQTTKPASATLLVTCDLACNWTLDGEAKGRIDAGGSIKAKVELGQHVVVATTEDSLDKVENEIEIKTPGQTIVHIALQPIRDVRLKAEQQARDKADQEARDKAAREQREKDRQERERVAREEAARPTWTDPATGLIWAKKDNDSNVTWQQADTYCRSLRLAGYSDWRLPTIDELHGIYDSSANAPGQMDIGSPGHPWVQPMTFLVKGNLQLSGVEWSSSQGDVWGEVWSFGFNGNLRQSNPRGLHYYLRALCVRRSRE